MLILRWYAACALVALAAGAAGTAGARGALDEERTVRQVEAILRSNSLLPRLSRDEILSLMHDIRAEDARAAASAPVAASAPAAASARTTPAPSMLLVHAYTPKDGFTLQELYTKPPKVEKVLVETSPAPAPARELSGSRLQAALTHNARLAESRRREEPVPAELQAFLDAHGTEADRVLLPLEGFKPLPPARVVDGSVQLPENLLLAYDLISPAQELDGAASEALETRYPLPMPAAPAPGPLLPPTYEPVDYDSVKVIPLGKGVSPVSDARPGADTEHSKRQANATETTEVPRAATTAAAEDSAGAAASAEGGASLADLEASFGGAAPEEAGGADLPPPRKNGFYWMLDWNSFLEVGDGDSRVNIRLEPKLGDPQMFLPVSVP